MTLRGKAKDLVRVKVLGKVRGKVGIISGNHLCKARAVTGVIITPLKPPNKDLHKVRGLPIPNLPSLTQNQLLTQTPLRINHRGAQVKVKGNPLIRAVF